MADFTLVPKWVEPFEPEFHNIVTPSESMKKNYQNISVSGIYKFKLIFKGLSDTNFWTLYNHFAANKGGYASFSWTSVPSYIDTDQSGTGDGANLTGRWIEGSFKFNPKATSWDAEIAFEKAVA